MWFLSATVVATLHVRAAGQLGRQWAGIDISHKAAKQLVVDRLDGQSASTADQAGVALAPQAVAAKPEPDYLDSLRRRSEGVIDLT